MPHPLIKIPRNPHELEVLKVSINMLPYNTAADRTKIDALIELVDDWYEKTRGLEAEAADFDMPRRNFD